MRKSIRQFRRSFVIIGLCGLALTARAAERALEARKLFPQITAGIYNDAGKRVMNCQIAADGLTVTDAVWNDYAPPPGQGKRWSFNQTPPTETPLVGYTFDASLAGMQVTVTEEIFMRDNPWKVVETYQEILQLGGKAQAGTPAWFHVPQTRLAYDFDEGTWFPSGWSLPKGKFGCWEGAGKYTQTDRGGHHPMLDFGFTQIAENTLSANGQVPPKPQQCRVFGDAEWLQIDDGTNWKLWHNDSWINRGSYMKIVIPDFENGGHWQWNDSQFDTFRDLVGGFKRERPDCLFGCWGIGVIPHSLRIFDRFDTDGRPTGVIDETAAGQWKAQYDTPRAHMNRIFDHCGLNFGNPSVYWLNGGNPAQLYAVVQEWEVGKLARPDVSNVISTWIQTEFVDGYPLSTYRFPGADGASIVRGIKHQAPPSYTYALSLFAHCRMDGAYCWETGNGYSENVADAGIAGEGGMQIPVLREFHGVTKNVFYYIKYFGFYNYHVLGMWQASRHKGIIEAATPWLMPEIRTSTHHSWRTGDQRYPSYCNFHKEPLVRAKASADGKELLVIACNPYNKGAQTVDIRLPGSDRHYTMKLAADYPAIRRFSVTEAAADSEPK